MITEASRDMLDAYEAFSIEVPTLEIVLFENTGVPIGDVVPRELRTFMKVALIIDALEFPVGLTQKKGLLVYSLWEKNGSFPDGLGRAVNEDEEGLRMLIEMVLEDERLDPYFDQINMLGASIPPGKKTSIKSVAKFKSNILSALSTIRQIDHAEPLETDETYDTVEKIHKAEEEFFSLNPEALEVLELKQRGLSHLEIARQLHRSLSSIDNLSRALVFFKKIVPSKLHVEKVTEYDEFLMQVLELRESWGLSAQEIATELNVDLRKVIEANKFLLWIRLAHKKDRRQVLLKRYDTNRHITLLSEYLDSFPNNGTVNLRKSHVDFCALNGIEISYDKFLSMYHHLESHRVVPPTKATSRDRVRELMIDEIAKIRAENPNATIFVGDLCRRLNISENVGLEVFNTIDNTGLSNTRKGREEGGARVIQILKRIAEANEVANLKAVATEAGVSPKLVYRVYHQMKGEMHLPEIRRRVMGDPIIASVVFES